MNLAFILLQALDSHRFDFLIYLIVIIGIILGGVFLYRKVQNEKIELNIESKIKPDEHITPIKNYNGLIKLCIFLLFIGGCMYYIEKKDNNNSASTSLPAHTYFDNATGKIKKQVKCTWCGGIGRVGYAGDSEIQVQRTGMGLGNICIRCAGTGYMDEDADK